MKNLILTSPLLGLIVASFIFFPRFFSLLGGISAPDISPPAVETILPSQIPGTSTIESTLPVIDATALPASTATPAVVITAVPVETRPAAITEEPTPTQISSVISEQSLFFPVIYRQPEPPPPPPDEPAQKLLICNSENFDIPDNYPPGITSTTHISDPRFIVDLDVRLDVEHSFVGDLVLTLTHQETGRTITLVDRPGLPGSNSGCQENDIAAILDDDITLPVENSCSDKLAAVSGIFTPDQPLHTFAQEAIEGNWSLIVSDNARNDTGQLQEWCLTATLSEQPIPPVEPPQPPDIPEQAQIHGVKGQGQALPLDCESRSAVDWANFFGFQINEFTFFNRLPVSENPDKGFVGDVYGTWGQIPPHDYGVHADPIAKSLSKYGLEAVAHRPLTWDQLRSEIASGRPVITWIVGSVVNGIPEYYLPPDEQLTIVARYEHTVIVTGYTSDSVTYLNGANSYTKSRQDFLQSWSALGNMAVTKKP
jgi:subtilisin-like proprotein convertase family protein/uncharacterized protein YvpB